VNINVTGRHVDVTPALRDYALEKVQKLVHFFPRLTWGHVTMRIEGESHVVEILISAPRGVTLVGEEAAGNMYAAIDLVLDKLGRQLKRHKEKMKDHRHDVPMDGGGMVPPPPPADEEE